MLLRKAWEERRCKWEEQEGGWCKEQEGGWCKRQVET